MSVESLKVLVVDDDPVVLEVTRAAIAALGHRVVTKQGALGTAVAILRERPDVVLVDLQMPALSGHEIIRLVGEQELRAGSRRTAFILYSGTPASNLEEVALRAGAIGAIRKTPDLVELRRAFEKLVAPLVGPRC
jgi:CheY-like chemotaxis protein